MGCRGIEEEPEGVQLGVEGRVGVLEVEVMLEEVEGLGGVLRGVEEEEVSGEGAGEEVVASLAYGEVLEVGEVVEDFLEVVEGVGVVSLEALEGEVSAGVGPEEGGPGGGVGVAALLGGLDVELELSSGGGEVVVGGVGCGEEALGAGESGGITELELE